MRKESKGGKWTRNRRMRLAVAAAGIAVAVSAARYPIEVFSTMAG